jgi:signal transduction histidine kinase
LQAFRRKQSQTNTDELRRREEIMYRVIHDILSPISGIRGAAELLAGDDYPLELRRELGVALLGGLDQLLAGLQDLNRYFRLQTGRSKLEMIPLDVQNVARKVIATKEADAHKKGSRIEFEAPEGEVMVLGDPVSLTQIFSELLTNAIKFSPPGATIWSRLTKPAPCMRTLGGDDDGQLWVRLEVEDRGPGLSDEERRKLFQEFTRLTPQPTGGERGMGMGLCIAQRLATLQNGRIEVDSQRARGSKFTLVIPARTVKPGAS